MSERLRERDTTYSESPIVVAGGRYDHTSDVGDYKIHGVKFDNTYKEYNRSGNFHDSLIGTIESITDDDSGHGQYNEVHHTKMEYNAPLMPVKSRNEGVYKGHDALVETTGLSAVRTHLLTWSRERANQFGDTDVNAAQRAVNGMQFSIQDAPFNLPVFLGELRDFRDVGTRITKALTRHRVRIGRKEGERLSLLEGIQKAASADLTVQFVLKPLLNDLQNMMKTGRHLSSQMDRLRGAKPVVVRNTVVDRDEAPYYYKSSYPHYHKDRVESSGVRSITSWARVKYDYGNFPEPNEAMLLLDSLGFDQPISNIWELVPFSFLVDYFLEVGNFLKQFQGDLIDLPYTVLDSGYSVKRTYDTTVTCYFNAGYNASQWDNQNVGSYAVGTGRYTVYKRIKGLSFEMPAIPKLSLPSARQIGNIADLIILFK